MNNRKPSLEEAIRSLLTEQKNNKYPKSQWKKEEKPSVDIGGQPHDPSGPNKSHIEEEGANIPSSQFGSRDNRNGHPFYRTLGATENRNWGGNQRRTPSTYNEELKAKFNKKVAEKRAGKTDTGQPAEVFNPEPELKSLH
jgi:glycosidase